MCKSLTAAVIEELTMGDTVIDDDVIMLGGVRVIGYHQLPRGHVGLIVPTPKQEICWDDVLSLMIDAVDQYDFVRPGILPRLLESIQAAFCDGTVPFSVAIPLRRCCDRKNLCCCDEKGGWVLKPLVPTELKIPPSTNLMLVVRKR